MTKTKIEWCDYTWNPIIGCANECDYCYAKGINDRFKFVKDWTKPELFPHKLSEPSKLRKPSKIFVGSMCDVMGKRVSSEWIASIVRECIYNPQHTFMFLTKQAWRYAEYVFPKNCQLGMTMTKPNEHAYYKFANLPNQNFKYLSIEPLMSDFTGFDLSAMDLVIIGAMTGKNPIMPERKWIDSIKHHNIFYKSNIQKYLDEKIKTNKTE
jgi:protein gp37